VEASTDIALRIIVRLAASLLAFGASFILLHRQRALDRREIFIAAALFCGVLSIDAAAFLSPPGSRFLPLAVLVLCAIVLAGAGAALRARRARAVALAAMATVITALLSFILLEAYGILLK